MTPQPGRITALLRRARRQAWYDRPGPVNPVGRADRFRRDRGRFETSPMYRVVTIDGPAGAGKSTVARRLAERLGWRFLDTGAMYRVATLAALRAGIDLSSEEALAELVSGLKITLLPDKVLLLEEDVSSAIRSAEITQASRFVADSPGVRRQLVQRQREFASEQDTVTEGRDQGTIVFPQATCKFFITASNDERARRRLAEHEARGEPATFESVLAAQIARDARDEARAIAPM